MDETLRKQIDAWTETDEHGRIVDMLGQISPEERDSLFPLLWKRRDLKIVSVR